MGMRRLNIVIYRLRKRINSFFKTSLSKELFIFLGFVVLSFFFWLLQAMNEDVEDTFKIPVEVTNLPDKVMLINDPPAYINARLRDKGPIIIGYSVNRISPVKIDFSTLSGKDGKVAVTSSKFTDYIRKEIRNTTQLIAFSPDSLQIYYTTNPGKKIPLVIDGDVSTSPQCVMSGQIRSSTDSVMVYAPSHILRHLKKVSTVHFSAQQLSDTLKTQVNILHIPCAKILQYKVSLMIPVEELTSKSLTLPVIPQGLPEMWKIMTFPSSVKLTCMVPVSMFSSLSERDFLIGVNYKKARNTTDKKLPVEILKYPSFVRTIELIPDSVEFVLEENL